AMPRGGTLRIELENVAGVTDAGDGSTPPSSRSIRLTVTDTGVGMDSQTLARVFEPFFTTRPRGSGSGLGLSMVYGVIERAGGRVSSTSELGIGTSLRIELPRAAQGRTKSSEPPPPMLPRPLSARVLVVEDEPLVRSVTRYYLEAAGCEVLEART